MLDRYSVVPQIACRVTDLNGMCGFPGLPWHPCPPGRKGEDGWGFWISQAAKTAVKFGKGRVAAIGPGALAGGHAGVLFSSADIGIIVGGGLGCIAGGIGTLMAPPGYNPWQIVDTAKYMALPAHAQVVK